MQSVESGMRPAVLVLTNSQDGVHSDVVIAKLRARGERIVRFDADRIASGELKISVNARGDYFDVRLRSSELTLGFEEVQSIWYRRPQWFGMQISDPVQRQYTEDELEILLSGLWLVLPDTIFWMNHPNHLAKARRKVYQLKLAQTLGFSIPKTLITNDPDEARTFIDACEGRAIFKTIHRETLDYGETHLNIPTTLVTDELKAKLDLVRRLPSCFQEALPKQAEVRVTIVRDKIFAVQTIPKHSEPCGIDWRHPEILAELHHTLVTLPQTIIEQCRHMMTTLELSFAALDFVIPPDGRWVFLEINPNGQWYWIEHLTGAPISDALADSLSTATRERR